MKELKDFAKRVHDKLPDHLKKKINIESLKYNTTIAMFSLLFDVYPPEQLFLDGYKLPIPPVRV